MKNALLWESLGRNAVLRTKTCAGMRWIMTEIIHMVRNVTLFLIIGNILSNLFSGSHYRKFFTFIIGVIVVAMVITPVFTILKNDYVFEEYLKKSILSIEKSEMETDIQREGKAMEERIWTEYEEQVTQIVLDGFGLTPDRAWVEVDFYKEGDKKGYIRSVMIHTEHIPENLGNVLNSLSAKLGIRGDKIMIDRRYSD
ncbi:MAG: stage III sporulation protein AF [Lachnoclostridium sp.]|jgi:uncharacterized membrane protein|nr:stage III sporulation protein AF [Lachnoclostridium sp.]